MMPWNAGEVLSKVLAKGPSILADASLKVGWNLIAMDEKTLVLNADGCDSHGKSVRLKKSLNDQSSFALRNKKIHAAFVACCRELNRPVFAGLKKRDPWMEQSWLPERQEVIDWPKLNRSRWLQSAPHWWVNFGVPCC